MNRQKIKIYGIGQTSMIAAIMLSKNFDVELLDSKKEVKQSHFALLRFGTDKIEKETGIKLKETKIKNIQEHFGGIIGRVETYTLTNLQESETLSNNIYDWLRTQKGHNG